MINAELNALYEKYWPELASFRKKYNLSGPLLMKLTKPEVKLLIVGHETYGWWNNESLSKLRERYALALKTCLASEKPNNKVIDDWNAWDTYNSKFWITIRKLKEELNIDLEKECIAWSNLNRMDNGAKKPPYVPLNKISEEMINKFPLLPEEIRICNPKIIVFLTWDDTYILKKTYKSIGDIKYEEIPESNKELLRVKIPNFKGKAYEIRHPNYIEGRGKKKIKYHTNELIKMIAKDYTQKN